MSSRLKADMAEERRKFRRGSFWARLEAFILAFAGYPALRHYGDDIRNCPACRANAKGGLR
jgi:hypothetical protein